MASNDNVIQFPNAAREDNQGRRLIPNRLIEARLAERLNQSELAAEIGVTRQSISAYEHGTKTPEPATMQALADCLNQPISFFVSEPAETFGPTGVRFFRKVGPDTKKRNLACEVYANWLAQTAYIFDDIVNFPEVDLPTYGPESHETNRYSEEEIEDIAEEVREHFGLGLGPISNVLRLLETKGIIVSRLEISGENVEAFSFWNGSRPFILLASDKNSAARARFDAAHELGHLVLHPWIGSEEIEDKQTLKKIEREADRFAGAFLLPRKSFPNEIYSPRLEAFVELKKRWKVAIQAMVYRCKDLGIFDEQQITNLYKQISFKKWRKQEPMDAGPDAIPLEEPLLLRKVTEVAFGSGNMRRDELKLQLGFSPQTIEALAGLNPGSLADKSPEDYQPTLK